MTTLRHSRTVAPATPRVDRAGYVLLIAGGAAFFTGGPLHPEGSEAGDRTEQLHSMLVDPAWYPAHLVALVGFACVAAGLLALGRNPVIRDRLGRLLPISAAVAVVATLGAVIHLFAATQAGEIAHGHTTPLVAAFMGVETLVNPAWGLMIAALAVAGGLTRALGNRIVLPLGLLGGLAFALATATIAFVDTFDPLFPVAGLAGLWLVTTGVIGLARSFHTSHEGPWTHSASVDPQQRVQKSQMGPKTRKGAKEAEGVQASPRRAVRTMRLLAVAGALVAALLGMPAIAAGPPPRGLYLALGDSVAAGVGAQPPATEGYVPELHNLLAAQVACGDGRALGCRLDLLNIAEPGGTTTTLLARQLPRAVSLITQRRATATPIDDVRLITLDIGGNDAFGPILQACSSDPQAPGCATTISTVLGAVATNYQTILSGLREAAGPDTTIAVMTYYNPLPACVLAAQTRLADLVLEGGGLVPTGLNDIIRGQAAAHDAVVAETGPLIQVHDLVGGRDCLHPDTSGHDDIAAAFDAVIDASEVIRPG